MLHVERALLQSGVPGVAQWPASFAPTASEKPLSSGQHHCLLSCATHSSHVVATGVGAGGGVGAGPGPPHASEFKQSEHWQSTGFEHVARLSVQPVPGTRQRGLSQHHSMLSCATHSSHVVAGGGVGAGDGIGVGAAGPPHASELSQSEHAQSTALVHVARLSVQPVPI